MEEVRFDRMVPSLVRARREACNLAYLPVGALEWHGSHLPFGTDCLTVAYLAEEAARRFGGVAFPPICHGDVRYFLHDCRVEWRQTYAREMGISQSFANVFSLEIAKDTGDHDTPTQPDDGEPAEEPLDFTREGQEREFVRHIAKTLLVIHLYGFRNIILLPGHGPNLVYCPRAEEVYRQNVRRRTAFGPPARTLTFFYIEAGKESEPLLKNHWIHADKWEGSFTMVAAPGTVRLDLLPEDRRALAPAYLGFPYLTESAGRNPELQHLWPSFDALDPRNGSEEYGRAQVEAVLERFGEVVRGFVSG